MGYVIPFPKDAAPVDRRDERLDLDEILEGRPSAEILLFTGVRYVRDDSLDERETKCSDGSGFGDDELDVCDA